MQPISAVIVFINDAITGKKYNPSLSIKPNNYLAHHCHYVCQQALLIILFIFFIQTRTFNNTIRPF